MAKTVRAIPATISRYTSSPINSRKKRKVAGYARVSTDHDDQITSYEAQVDYYTNYIKGRDDWEFVGIYTDEGISGTNTRHRDGFKRMVNDALEGKIDLIITKSVSRFARNTVDSLSTIRKLKEHKIECYFEKENIWTFDSKGELLLTIMSSLAQEGKPEYFRKCHLGSSEAVCRWQSQRRLQPFPGIQERPERWASSCTRRSNNDQAHLQAIPRRLGNNNYCQATNKTRT